MHISVLFILYYSFMYIYSNHFILVRITVSSEPIPGTPWDETRLFELLCMVCDWTCVSACECRMLDAVSVTVSWFAQHGNGTLPPPSENTSVGPTSPSQANISQPHSCLRVLYEDIGSSRYVCLYTAGINPGIRSILYVSSDLIGSSDSMCVITLALSPGILIR